jgi:hypothetical protein
MTDDRDVTQTPAGPSSAVKRVQQTIGAAKDAVANADLDQIRAKAGETATALYRQGRDVLANAPDFDTAKDELRESIRKNPLAAIGIAFTAGLLVALITRG